MAQGFRAAHAFVEVTADLDERDVLTSARRAAAGMERTLDQGARAAGTAMSATLGRAGTHAGEQLVRGVDGRLRDSRGRFAKTAASAGIDMGASLGQHMMTNASRSVKMLAHPGIIVPLTTVAVASAPFIGALLGAGIVTAVAGAGIGGGIALAVRDPEIKAAAADTGKRIMTTLESAAEPFKGAILDALRVGEQAMQRWEPHIRRILSMSSTLLDPLVRGITGMVDGILPGMTRALQGAKPVMDALSYGLAMVGRELGVMFENLGDNGPEMAAAMVLAFQLISGAIKATGMVINGLTEAFGVVIELAAEAARYFGAMGLKMRDLPGPLGEIGQKMFELSETVEDGKVKWDGMRERMTTATESGRDGTRAMSEQTKLLSLSMGAAIVQAGSLGAAFDALNGKALNAREAESNYQAAIDNVTASIKANGKTLDLHTEKGRANDAAIRALVASTNAKAQAAYTATEATKGTAAAEQAARGVYEQGRAQLIKNLTQILGNAGAARKLAGEIMAIPKSWGTKVTADTSGAKGAITSYKSWLASIPRTVYTRMIVEQQSARGGHKEFNRWGGLYDASGVRHMATGGVLEAHATNKQTVIYGERETGGEAFIPRRGDKTRSTKILGQAADWYDMDVVPKGGRGQGGSQTIYQFAPGSITLDASGIRSVADLIDMIERLPQTARAMGAMA